MTALSVVKFQGVTRVRIFMFYRFICLFFPRSGRRFLFK